VDEGDRGRERGRGAAGQARRVLTEGRTTRERRREGFFTEPRNDFFLFFFLFFLFFFLFFLFFYFFFFYRIYSSPTP
jgi:hypothetical protein